MKIGDKVSVPMYIGLTQHQLVYKDAIIVKAYPKGRLGTMYLCRTIPSGFRTCIVVPPPPRIQPDGVRKVLARPDEPSCSTTYQKRAHERTQRLILKYDEMIRELGLDPSIKRSLHSLRSIAQYRGYNIHEIENRD